MRRSAQRLAISLIALGLSVAPVSPGRVSSQTESESFEHVTLQTLPNGDRIGEVRKPAGAAVRGPLYDAPPPRPDRPDHEHAKARILDDRTVAGASPVAETNDDGVQPQAPGTFLLKRDTPLAPPSGFTSNVNEPSAGGQGDAILQTGNWYAFVSTNNGGSFAFIDPESTFPKSPVAFSVGFCCDQRVAQDPSRDLVFWFLQYTKTGTGSTDTNGVRIAVAHGAADLASNTWQMHDFTPADFGFGLGKWLDFPTMQVSLNFLYFTSNVFDTSGGAATHAVIGRIPLNALNSNTAFTMNTFVTDQFDTITPVSGATTTMFFGSVFTTTSLKVLSWPESSAAPVTSTVGGLSPTNTGTFRCPGPDGLDPCTRADTRMQTGWATSAEVGFMWSSAQGTNRPFPFVRTVILSPTLSLLSQPDIRNDSYAFLYPAIAVNARGHLGGEVSSLGGSRFPTIDAIIRDDFSPDVVTSGWEIHQVATSTAGTQGRWGDYSGAVAHEKHPNTWLGAGHVQVGGSANSNARPHNFWFMRERDDPATVVVGTPTPTPTRLPGVTPTSTPTAGPTRTPIATATPGPTISCSGLARSDALAPPAGASGLSTKATPPIEGTPANRTIGSQTFTAVPYEEGAGPSDHGPMGVPGPGWSTITCETFESAWPSAGWTTFDNDGATNGDYCWGAATLQARFGARSIWPAAGCANALDPARFFYPNSATSWTVFGPFSLADASDADVHFSVWQQMERGFDFLFWGASTDNKGFSGFQTTGDSTTTEPPTTSGWRDITFDLKNVPKLGNLLGQPNVWLAWVFTSDSSGVDDGPFVDDVLIHKILGTPPATATPTPGTPRPTASPTPATPRPTATPTPSAVVPAALGGRGFGISSSTSGVTMTWQSGTGQTGYAILRFLGSLATILPPTGTLAPTATSHLDSSPTAGLVCYLLLTLGGSPPAPIGLGDLECVFPNIRSATGSPQNFTMRLNQSNVASFSWQGPLGGGQDGFALFPLGEAPIPLAGSATGATHAMAGPTCYALFATRGGVAIGNTDILCGIPGVSTLGATDTR